MANVSLGDGRTASEEGHVGNGWRGCVAEAINHAGHRKASGKPTCGGEGHIRLAPDQHAAVRPHGKGRSGHCLHHGLGKQGRHLRARIRPLSGPAGALANVGEVKVCLCVIQRGRFLEHRRFLGAGNQQVAGRGGGIDEGVDLRPAQVPVATQVCLAGAVDDGGVVELGMVSSQEHTMVRMSALGIRGPSRRRYSRVSATSCLNRAECAQIVEQDGRNIFRS